MLRHGEAAPAPSAPPAPSTPPTAAGDHAVTAAPQACSAASLTAGPHSYTSTQLADAYGLNQVLDQGGLALGEDVAITIVIPRIPAIRSGRRVNAILGIIRTLHGDHLPSLDVRATLRSGDVC